MGQKDEIILININGTDRPGVTAALTEILAKNNAVILDIGQADIHNNLSLGILFQSSEGNSGDILKELLFKSYELDVSVSTRSPRKLITNGFPCKARTDI